MENQIYDLINARYNLDFLEQIKSIEGLEVYVFGGMLRDYVLGRQWKEVDLRIILNKDRVDREQVLESALSAYNLEGKTQIENLNLTVYRFLPDGSNTTEPIDLSLVPTINDNLPDFTANSLFFDLINKKMVDRFEGRDALQHKILRTVKDPEQQFKEEPHMMFRALKFACQLDFAIDPETEAAIRDNALLAKGTLAFIATAQKGIFVELFLGNIFKGLKSNPKKYFKYLNKLGLFGVIVDFAAEELGASQLEIQYPVEDMGNFEKNISYLFTCVIDSIQGIDKERMFKRVVEKLAITTPKEYSDFVINPQGVTYLR